MALSALVAVAVVLGLYVGLPRIAGLDETWGRLSRGDPCWLVAAVVLELGSYAGYVVLFRGIFVRPGLPHRLARELPDHDGGRGGHAALRRRRRRRHRADRLGAGARRHAASRARARA